MSTSANIKFQRNFGGLERTGMVYLEYFLVEFLNTFLHFIYIGCYHFKRSFDYLPIYKAIRELRLI